VIKVPLRGIKEYRFVYGENEGGVAQGNGDSKPGQVSAKPSVEGEKGEDRAGDRPGHDFYETDVTLEELIDIMFEDLELPDMERPGAAADLGATALQAQGLPLEGNSRPSRQAADRARQAPSPARSPAPSARPQPGNRKKRHASRSHEDDLTYRHVVPEERPRIERPS